MLKILKWKKNHFHVSSFDLEPFKPNSVELHNLRKKVEELEIQEAKMKIDMNRKEREYQTKRNQIEAANDELVISNDKGTKNNGLNRIFTLLFSTSITPRASKRDNSSKIRAGSNSQYSCKRSLHPCWPRKGSAAELFSYRSPVQSL